MTAYEQWRDANIAKLVEKWIKLRRERVREAIAFEHYAMREWERNGKTVNEEKIR